MKKLFLLSLLTILFTGCVMKSHRHKNVKVHTYKSDVDLDFIYLILEDDGGCYYAKSSTPITNFSSVRWTASQTVPKEISDKEFQELDEKDVELSELDQEMQQEIETEADSFDNSTSESSDSGSDGGGDSGGGDGGGGDGGGGDGGGGGD